MGCGKLLAARAVGSAAVSSSLPDLVRLVIETGQGQPDAGACLHQPVIAVRELPLCVLVACCLSDAADAVGEGRDRAVQARQDGEVIVFGEFPGEGVIGVHVAAEFFGGVHDGFGDLVGGVPVHLRSLPSGTAAGSSGTARGARRGCAGSHHPGGGCLVRAWRGSMCSSSLHIANGPVLPSRTGSWWSRWSAARWPYRCRAEGAALPRRATRR